MENIQHVQDYVLGRLSKEAQQQFESDMQTDPTLAEEVANYKNLKTVFQYDEERNMRRVAADMTAQYIKNKPKPSIFRRFGLLFGIGALAIVASIFLFQRYQQSQLDALIAPYWQEDPYEMTVKFRDDDPSTFAKGMTAYQNKNYPEAIRSLRQHIQLRPDDALAHLYLGIAYTLSDKGETEAALGQLQPLIQTESDLIDTNVARWYAALCLIKQGKMAEARPILTALSTNNVYGERAKTILK